MKFFVVVLLAIALFSCSNNNPKLEKGSIDYELAAKLAEKVPAFNPDENMVIVTTNEFDVTIAEIVKRIRSRFGGQSNRLPDEPAENIKKVLKEFGETVAITEIIALEAEKEGIILSESRIDSIVEAQYQMFGGKDKFIEFAAKNGVSEESVREDMKMNEIQKQYVELKKDELTRILPEEVDALLESDRLASVRHILLLTQGKSEDEKKAKYSKAEKLLERAKAGEDFAKLATENTEDPGSKTNGGLYENFPKGQMVPSFEEAAFTVPVGEISDIVETPYGYHILKVVERKKEDRPRAVVESDLKSRKEKTVMNQIYEKLKEKYEIEVVDII